MHRLCNKSAKMLKAANISSKLPILSLSIIHTAPSLLPILPWAYSDYTLAQWLSTWVPQALYKDVVILSLLQPGETGPHTSFQEVDAEVD